MKSYLKYTGLAFQMGAAIGLMTYFGIYLDERFSSQHPWFTIALVLFAIVGSTVKLIVDLKKNEEGN